MRVAAKLASIVLCGGVWVACAGVPVQQLHPRSAFDLGCPEQQLTFTELGGSCSTWDENSPCTMGVTGCGKHATYILRGEAWVMNNASTSSEGAPGATPPAK